MKVKEHILLPKFFCQRATLCFPFWSYHDFKNSKILKVWPWKWRAKTLMNCISLMAYCPLSICKRVPIPMLMLCGFAAIETCKSVKFWVWSWKLRLRTQAMFAEVWWPNIPCQHVKYIKILLSSAINPLTAK